MRTKVISGCDSCVFAYDNDRRKLSCDLARIIVEDVSDGEVHRDCPLRRGPLKFVLAEEVAANNDVVKSKRCKGCGKFFPLTFGELRFLKDKFDAEFKEPGWCGACRMERRKANEK